MTRAAETTPGPRLVPVPGPAGGTARPGTHEPDAAHRALGQWLREQRQARAWDVPQMAQMLAQAAGPDRGRLPSINTLRTYVRRWEHGDAGVSERYRLLYCTALGIPLAQFGPHGSHPPGTPQPPAPAAPPATDDAPPSPGSGPPPGWCPVIITITITPAPPPGTTPDSPP